MQALAVLVHGRSLMGVDYRTIRLLSGVIEAMGLAGLALVPLCECSTR